MDVCQSEFPLYLPVVFVVDANHVSAEALTPADSMWAEFFAESTILSGAQAREFVIYDYGCFGAVELVFDSNFHAVLRLLFRPSHTHFITPSITPVNLFLHFFVFLGWGCVIIHL